MSIEDKVLLARKIIRLDDMIKTREQTLELFDKYGLQNQFAKRTSELKEEIYNLRDTISKIDIISNN